MILTKDILAFASIHEDVKIDQIPMVEIESIRVMEDEADVNGEAMNSFFIKTMEDGHNTGRDYYLRADTIDLCRGTVKELKRLAKHAKFEADANYRLARSQYAVRRVFESSVVQYTSASLIILVRNGPACPTICSFCWRLLSAPL